MPAVSTMRNWRLCQVSTVSTASRVVPGTSLTIIRSSRSKRLTSDDLPALGRPTIAIDTSSGTGGSAGTAVGQLVIGVRAAPRPPARRPWSHGTRGSIDDRIEQVADAFARARR